ncbi:MAG: phage holin family protein, partial [Blastococcus sp.]
YHLVCLSDHGQTQGWAFADRFGESIEELVGRLCGAPVVPRKRHLTGPKDSRRTAESWQVTAALGEGAGPIARRLRQRVERAEPVRHDHELAGEPGGAVPQVAPGVVCVVSGHTAMVSFADIPGRVSLEEIERHWPDLLPGLVDHAGVGFLLVQSEEFGPVVLGRDGVHRLASGVVIGEDPLLPYGEHAAALVARVSSFPHCADVVINSRYDPETDEASAFEPHVGSHGGLGGPQQHGFLTYPRAWAAPGTIVGAEHLHRVLRGWLTDLGHPEPTGEGAAIGEDSRTALEAAATAAR